MFLLQERCHLSFFLVLCFIHQIVGPPTLHKTKDKDEKQKKEDINTNEINDPLLEDEQFNLEYERYLKEVVDILEKDEEFKKNIDEAMKRGDSRSEMSAHLHSVNRYTRGKLDELKRQEVERLRSLIKLKDPDHKYPVDPSIYAHIDHFNMDTFEPKDLENLINKASDDLDKINKLRHESFKQYEMEKHFEEEQKLKNMTEPEKEKYKKELEEMKKKHADHPKVHHPGSKAQLEEVWDKQDHLEHQEFNPKTFFHLHDLDGNGYWDIDEVNALFIKELDKLYQSGLPEDDLRERQEEMELMREHVFKEADANHDNMISLAEYLDMTNKSNFNKDEGWETLENKEIYSQHEYEEYERRRMAQMQKQMEAQGYHPQGPMDPGHHPQYQQYHPNQPQYHPNQPQYHPNQPQYHPNQPQYHPNQVPQQPYHPNQVPQQQYHPNQVHQQQQYHPNQVPQQQYHPNQVPQQQQYQHGQEQYHPNQVSGEQHLNQVPQQQHPNQVPQQQHPNQVPQQQQQHPKQVPQQQYQPVPQQGQQQPNQVQQPGQGAQPQANQIPQQQNINQQPNQVQQPVNPQNHQNVPINSNQQQGYQQNQNYPPSHVNPPV